MIHRTRSLSRFGNLQMALFIAVMAGVTALQGWGPPELTRYAPVFMLATWPVFMLVRRITLPAWEAHHCLPDDADSIDAGQSAQ